MRRSARDELIGRIGTCVRGGAPVADVAIGVRHTLIDLGREPDLLDAAQLQPDPDRYRSHVVHVADDGAFSVVSLVWLPGQHTLPHDHLAWCVVGVHRGMERETVFRRVGDGELVPVAVTHHETGSTSLALPPEDVHMVENASDDVAVSVHVYGVDLRRVGNSVRRYYPLPETTLAMASASGSGSPSITST